MPQDDRAAAMERLLSRVDADPQPVEDYTDELRALRDMIDERLAASAETSRED